MYRHFDDRGLNTLRVSQNYLTSSWIIDKLIRLTNLSAEDHVIEIGPGKGHITRALLQRCNHVTAVEIDEALCAKLLEKFTGAENLKLIQTDFLQWKLPVSGAYKVLSNIPFNRTTDIVRKLSECPNPPQDAWLVMERGAAKRFMGKPRESLRSLLLKPLFNMRIEYCFQREDFHPMPRVDAVLLHISKKALPDVTPAQWKAYVKFVTAGMRRNTGSACPGDIRYVQWLCLFRRKHAY